MQNYVGGFSVVVVLVVLVVVVVVVVVVIVVIVVVVVVVVVAGVEVEVIVKISNRNPSFRTIRRSIRFRVRSFLIEWQAPTPQLCFNTRKK